MRDRWYCKASKNKYDPQIGEAAKANVALAERSEAWNRDYFDKYVAPAMSQLIKESDTNIERQGQLFDLTYDQAKLADERYRTLGVPAEDRYYKMVDEYSAPEEQEKQARSAIGDVRTAAQSQAGTLARKLGSLGIDPTSPAALAARSDASVMNTATEAGAATRAREGAKALGMQLTSDAANFGRGGFASILQAGGAAGGASGAGLSGAAAAAGTTPGGAANVNTGYGIAQKGYGANLDAYTSLGNTSMNTSSSPLAGIGMLAGQMGSAALGNTSLFKSDRRLKKDANRLATMAHGVVLWAFRYIWEPASAPLRFGYMADEVELLFPDAVMVGPDGYKMVDYSKVPI